MNEFNYRFNFSSFNKTQNCYSLKNTNLKLSYDCILANNDNKKSQLVVKIIITFILIVFCLLMFYVLYTQIKKCVVIEERMIV